MIIKILFICRRHMAEFVMKDLVKKARLETQFHIESTATSTEEIGNPVYPPASRNTVAAAKARHVGTSSISLAPAFFCKNTRGHK